MVFDPRQRSTQCSVELLTPANIRLVFDTRDAEGHLLHVSTHNDMAESCGAFTLTLAPVLVEGRTYDELIPLRTLVTIRMTAQGDVETDAASVVMVGLTEDHGLQEDYSAAPPRRVVQISGRSMAAVFLDMHLRHYPGLEETTAGVLKYQDAYFNLFIPTNFLAPDLDPRDALRAIFTYFLGLKTAQPLAPHADYLQRQLQLRQQQAAQPGTPLAQLEREIAQQTRRAPPVLVRPGGRPPGPLANHQTALGVAHHMDAWEAAHPGFSNEDHAAEVQRYLALKGEPAFVMQGTRPADQQRQVQVPSATAQQTVRQHNVLMNLQLPGKSLAELLDLNDASWTLFDDNVVVPIGHNTPYALTLWHYLHQFVDTAFQEFFTRVEDGVVKIFFRAKPFLDTTDFTGTRFRDNDPTCRTLAFDATHWDARYLGGQFRRQSANVYNAFHVLPYWSYTGKNDVSLEVLIPPVVIDDPHHPSYLPKYGVRELPDKSKYISTKKIEHPDPTEANKTHLQIIAKRWSALLAAWYGLGSEMYAGVITLVGSPTYNIGHRLLYRNARGDREGYIEGVTHDFDARTGRYLTHLRVTRLWYLAGLVDERVLRGAGDVEVVVHD